LLNLQTPTAAVQCIFVSLLSPRRALPTLCGCKFSRVGLKIGLAASGRREKKHCSLFPRRAPVLEKDECTFETFNDFEAQSGRCLLGVNYFVQKMI